MVSNLSHVQDIKEVLDTVHSLAKKADDQNKLEELLRGLCVDLAKYIKEYTNETENS